MYDLYKISVQLKNAKIIESREWLSKPVWKRENSSIKIQIFFFSSFINFSWFEEFEKKYFCDQGEYFVNVNNYDWNWIFLHAIEWPLNNNNRIGKRIWKKDNNKKVYQSIWTTLNTLCKYCNMFVSYFMVLLCYFFPFTHILCIQYTRTHTHQLWSTNHVFKSFLPLHIRHNELWFENCLTCYDIMNILYSVFDMAGVRTNSLNQIIYRTWFDRC